MESAADMALTVTRGVVPVDSPPGSDTPTDTPVIMMASAAAASASPLVVDVSPAAPAAAAPATWEGLPEGRVEPPPG